MSDSQNKIKSFQGVVYPFECDHMGHMNVKYYTEKFDQAIWSFFSYLGMTSAYFRSKNRGMVALEQNIKYLKELLPGDCIYILSEGIEIKNKTILLKHSMYKLEDQELASTTEILGLHIDTNRRKGVSFPDFVSEKFRYLLKNDNET